MLVAKLQIAIDRLQALSGEQQEALAEQIETFLDEAQWDAQFADPRSEAFFDEMLEDSKVTHRCPPDEKEAVR